MLSWITDPALKNIALVGISKNSGKTSILNHLIQSFPGLDWGVMTTGIDGEEQDAIFKTPKPKVKLLAGNIFCCDSRTLDLHGSKVSILHGESCSGRKLWLVKALEALETEITGPSVVSAQIRMAKRIQSLGAGKVLIDGSLDRKSIALEADVHALILAIGASFGNLEAITKEVSRLRLLASIPAVESGTYVLRKLRKSTTILTLGNRGWQDTTLTSLIGHEKALHTILESAPTAVYIPGAYTEGMHIKLVKVLAQSSTRMIFRHPECLKLELGDLNSLLKQNQVQCLIPFRIKAYALNSWSVHGTAQDAQIFRDSLRQAFPDEYLIDIREIG